MWRDPSRHPVGRRLGRGSACARRSREAVEAIASLTRREMNCRLSTERSRPTCRPSGCSPRHRQWCTISTLQGFTICGVIPVARPLRSDDQHPLGSRGVIPQVLTAPFRCRRPKVVCLRNGAVRDRKRRCCDSDDGWQARIHFPHYLRREATARLTSWASPRNQLVALQGCPLTSKTRSYMTSAITRA